jgi:structural maintenance of chromosome 2
MKSTIAQLKETIIEAKARHDGATKDVKRIERDMKEFNNNKDNKLAELQSSLDKLKKALTKSNASIKPLQQEMRDAMVEAEQCGGDLTSAQEELQDVQVTISSQNDEIQNLTADRECVKDAHDLAQANLQDEQAKLSGFDDELKSIENAVRSKNSQITEESLEQQKLGHQIEKLEGEHTAAEKTLSALSKSYDWIEDEKDQFGRQGTPYDFRGQNMAECKATLKKKEEQISGMKKKINPKVMNMIDNVEKKEASLKNKLKTVIRDKRKIEETIETLDHYKKDALQKTWEKVNGDFGQIFNDLLPGSFAKLDPPEGKTISDGLEVKVCLGKVWKQSLTELSGGQR